MKFDGKYIVFDNDLEFERWAVNPTPVMGGEDQDFNGWAWNFTNNYIEACDKCLVPVILDPDSKIVRRQCVTCNTVGRRVSVMPGDRYQLRKDHEKRYYEKHQNA